MNNDEYITPEQLANKVIDKIKDKDGSIEFPIDPFKLLKSEGVIIAFKEFDRLEGIIINDSDNVTIVGINNNRPLSRQRFSAAHEYCHYLVDLNRVNGETDTIQCFSNSNSKREKYAEKFAAHLLMPTSELKKVCDEYKNDEGFIDFCNITVIAEYFGVSFKACLNRLAYDLSLIDGDISSEELKKRAKKYNPAKKREELIMDKIDSRLLGNTIDSMDFIMLDPKHYTGAKFIQNYIYNDNKIEGVSMDRSHLNYVLADLNYKKNSSEFFEQTSEDVCMTIGNLELQSYVNNTNDKVSIKKCRYLHELLYKYVPYPDDNGKFRINDAILQRGTVQPIPFNEIPHEIEKLEEELVYFVENCDKYKISEYIEQVAYFVYKFIVIHPFSDGNGRISRAILNWMLSLRKIPPIYIDERNKCEYYNSLSEIDQNSNFIPFIMLIEKRIISTMMEFNSYLFTEELDFFEEED